MNLNDAFAYLSGVLLASGIKVQPDDLIAFADEDMQGGRGMGEFDAWSIDADEGKVLYALVRALKPVQAIEIGVRHGASTVHLMRALEANGSGKLDSYDLEAAQNTRISPYAQANWTFHQGDALAAEFPPAEFVFEDGAHTLDFSLKIFERLKTFAHVVVTHDTNMTIAHGDFFVKQAFETVFPDGMLLVLDGCERGLGVWVNPERLIAEREAKAAEAKQAESPKPPAPAKKPTRAAKSK